jgi:hypothetical protein
MTARPEPGLTEARAALCEYNMRIAAGSISGSSTRREPASVTFVDRARSGAALAVEQLHV